MKNKIVKIYNKNDIVKELDEKISKIDKFSLGDTYKEYNKNSFFETIENDTIDKLTMKVNKNNFFIRLDLNN